MGFYSRLNEAWVANDSLLCVGLDPDLTKFPQTLHDSSKNSIDQIETFCKQIIDATGDLVCAFKPQIAYFAACGAEKQLENVCAYIRQQFPKVVLILDAKRGDIGDTAKLYAREAFERYGVDAVTVNPYLGTDSLSPFCQHLKRARLSCAEHQTLVRASFNRLKLTANRCIYELHEQQPILGK